MARGNRSGATRWRLPRWLMFGLYVVVPPAIGVVAERFAANPCPAFVKSYLEEMGHYLPVIGWIGIGAILFMEAFHAVADHMAPEFYESVSDAIAGVGDAIAACIATKKFVTEEMLEALTLRPQPLAESDKPTVVAIRKMFERGEADQAVAKAEEFIADAKQPESAKDDARRLLLQMYVYSSREQYWRKAAPLLAKFGTQELTALLGFKFWTSRHLSDAIAYGDEALRLAEGMNDSVKLARAKNNLAYYLADAREAAREADARRYAEEAYLAIDRAVGEGVKGADAVLRAKMLTTVGFVRITFAESVEECLQGTEDCIEGVKKGADAELLRSRHLPLATEKMAELQRGGLKSAAIAETAVALKSNPS
jgi:hypothetical protein